MKYLVLAVAFLSCAVASAMPKIGDYSAMNVILNNNPIGTLENELTQYDATKNQYLQVTTQTYSGTKQTSQSWTNGISDTEIANILAACTNYGGNPQTVTEPAGTFSTCALPVNNNGAVGQVWIGAVALGIVKIDLTQGANHIIADLASFRLGQ